MEQKSKSAQKETAMFVGKKIAKQVTELGGSGVFVAVAIFALILQEYVFAKQLFLAYVLAMTSIIVIKGCFFRQRPNKKTYSSLVEKINASSFPSAHTTRAFSFTWVVSFFIAKIEITIFLVVLSVVVGVTRIMLKKHYTSDVIGGAILGIIIGSIVTAIL